MSDNEKKKSWFARHKIMTGILAFILLMVVVQAAGGGNDTSNNTSNGSNTQETDSDDAATVATIGQTARDGKFEFTVKDIECGQTEVVHPETDALRDQAQGQFCLLSLTVKNIGNEQQYFSDSDQKLLNSEGVQYSADSSATITLGGTGDALLSQINPGNSVEGVLVFDIPKDQTPVAAELHDSAFSNGVRVNLQ